MNTLAMADPNGWMEDQFGPAGMKDYGSYDLSGYYVLGGLVLLGLAYFYISGLIKKHKEKQA